MSARTLPMMVAVLAVLLASPANASPPPEEEPPEPESLPSLISSIEAKIAAVSAPGLPLAEEGFQARVDLASARVDLAVGTARVGAAARVAWLFPGLGVAEAKLVFGGSGLLFDRAETSGPSTRWELWRVAETWRRLEERMEELRSVVAGRTPDRVCPVGADTEFTDDWHDARPGGRAHKGIDLHGEIGAPVLAVEAGTVIQANWHRGGGRQIFFTADGTGDVYFYAHLDTWAEWIWTGTRVAAGDVIGTLGRSGNADTPHLHFGWMPGSHVLDLENLQNPFPLLVEVCG